ncbi:MULTISPECIES: hypothetical protein [Streptomyces]|uniref:hypothetical protein n=1 Tax=Streptomyces TaxID=1883 RepID=UPI0004BE7E7A|nr:MULTISPECIES: hypothetical protein [Streptomyces]GHJ21616.1 hypothetical protein TPA0909_32300 [Streptomyces albus]
MTWRRLRVLLQHLPPESATMTAIRNSMSDEELDAQADAGEPEKGRWSQTEQLLALLADRVAQLQYTLICVNTEKKSQRPEVPEPIRRPGAKPRKKKTAPMSDAAAERLFLLINGGAA